MTAQMYSFNAFCCVCEDEYAYDAKALNYGRECDCVCECKPKTHDEWIEIHQEQTEQCCEQCDCDFEISAASWMLEKGDISNFCSDECEEEHRKEKEEEDREWRESLLEAKKSDEVTAE